MRPTSHFFRVEIKVNDNDDPVVMIGAAKSAVGAARGAVASIVSSERATPHEVAAYVREGCELHDWTGEQDDPAQDKIDMPEQEATRARASVRRRVKAAQEEV